MFKKMVEFEVFKTGKDGSYTVYHYKFKLNKSVFYAYFEVSEEKSRIFNEGDENVIEHFEVMDIKKRNDKESYVYRFNLYGETFYSCYIIYPLEPSIILHVRYYKESDLTHREGVFVKEDRNKILDIILNRKEIRLRHVVNPYKIII